MTLKRKDGSPYRLRSPNKLLINQQFWQNDDALQMHNLEQLAETIIGVEIDTKPHNDTKNDLPLPPSTNSHDIDIAEAIIKKTKKDVVIEQEKVKTPEPPVEVAVKNPSAFRSLAKHLLFCLPAEQSEYIDPLYQDKTIRLKYQKPFKFESTIAFNGDVKILYWTTVNLINEMSIIFHPSQRRWWKVQKKINDPSGDGVLLECYPSDIKPDFTETSSD